MSEEFRKQKTWRCRCGSDNRQRLDWSCFSCGSAHWSDVQKYAIVVFLLLMMPVLVASGNVLSGLPWNAGLGRTRGILAIFIGATGVINLVLLVLFLPPVILRANGWRRPVGVPLVACPMCGGTVHVSRQCSRCGFPFEAPPVGTPCAECRQPATAFRVAQTKESRYTSNTQQYIEVKTTKFAIALCPTCGTRSKRREQRQQRVFSAYIATVLAALLIFSLLRIGW